MTVLASDLISRSMKLLQALGSSEVPTAAEANDGLVALNAMLDSFSLEDLNSFVTQEQSFTLTVGTNSYTIGVGGVINVARPFDITQAYVQDGGGNNYLIGIQPRDKWNQIGNRGATITSQIPTDMFYDPQYPLGVINIFPTPLSAYQVFFDSTLAQTTFATLATALATPPGYERMYVYNLAVEISSMFGIPIPPVAPGQKNVAVLAMEALAKVKSKNIKDVISDYDPAVISHASPTYNIYRDA